MEKKDAEDYIYKSYMRAQNFQSYYQKDAKKRNPAITKSILQEKTKNPCVIITGSKGKGSVAAMISQCLQTECRVGLMTSPHIYDFCERFRVDGKVIPENTFAAIVESLVTEFDEIEAGLKPFECISPIGIQAAVGLEFFNRSSCKFNIFECGKGAKYDDVTNIPHQYGVINSIFLEHTRELGETISEIAEDKAHVIDGSQKCVFVGEQSGEALLIIKQRAAKLNVPLQVYGEDFFAKNIRYTSDGMVFDLVIGDDEYLDVCVKLLGEHQVKNCALALAFCKYVMQSFDIERLQAQLLQLKWPGRMEVLSKEPFVMIDCCINSVSCMNVMEILQKMKITDAVSIIGIPDDKDYLGVAKCISSLSSEIILTKSQNKHYVFTDKQVEVLEQNGIKSVFLTSIDAALNRAYAMKKPIIILGTTSVVAEVYAQYQWY